MLKPDEIDYLNKVPKDKKVKIYPFSSKSTEVAKEIINIIHNTYPDLEIKHVGASALKISGQNDLDIYIFSNPKNFDKYLPGIIEIFGEPLHRHETFCEWKLQKEEFNIELYLTAKDSPTMQKQIKVFETLRDNPDLLEEYEKLKKSMNGKSFKEYQEKKYEFYHKILDSKIRAILFDMVGVLVFKKPDYVARNHDEINAENIEKLFNNLDDQKLIKDIKETLGLSDFEIEKACRFIPEKYERFTVIWEKLPLLKKKYKIAVINNGNSIAIKNWKEKFNFGIFDLFINSAIEGVKKPDQKIFLLTCKRLHVKPEECVFMDDLLENVKSAQKLGMKTIWWSKEEKRMSLMRKFEKMFDLSPGE